MNGLMKKAGLGVALAATVLTAAAPADAQRWGRGYRGGGWGGYHHRGGGNAAGAAVLERVADRPLLWRAGPGSGLQLGPV